MKPMTVEEVVIVTLTNQLPEMTGIIEYFEEKGIKGNPLPNEEAKEIIQYKLTNVEFAEFKEEYGDAVNDSGHED